MLISITFLAGGNQVYIGFGVAVIFLRERPGRRLAPALAVLRGILSGDILDPHSQEEER